LSFFFLQQEIQRLKQMKLPENKRESQNAKPSNKVLQENERL